MEQPPQTPENRWPRFSLRSNHQVVVAVLVSASLVAMVGHWLYHDGHRGGVIEVDQVQPGAIEFTIDVNEAEWPEFTVLPGVGETLARRIVETRQERGGYRDLTELRTVRGIGPRTLERIRPYLRPIPDIEATADHAQPSRALP